jgi:hypothetical protein
MSILGHVHAMNVICGKNVMDLTGLLSVPSVWCAREDTNKTNFFTRTKMSGHRRNQKLQ